MRWVERTTDRCSWKRCRQVPVINYLPGATPLNRRLKLGFCERCYLRFHRILSRWSEEHPEEVKPFKSRSHGKLRIRPVGEQEVKRVRILPHRKLDLIQRELYS